MQTILKHDVIHPITFMMVETDHLTPLTGATPTVVISKNGGAFAAPAGSVSEVGHGVYALALAPAAADVNTSGPFNLYATASGGDSTNAVYQVVSWGSNADPYSPALGR